VERVGRKAGQSVSAGNAVLLCVGILAAVCALHTAPAADEEDAENLLVIRDSEIAAEYTRNWQEHLAHSVDYGGPTTE
jgi:hypothetical protein